MKASENIRQTFGNVKYALHLAYQMDEKYYLYRSLTALADTAQTVISVVFPAAVIGYLYPELRWEQAVICAAIWGMLRLLVSLSKNVLEKKAWFSNEKIINGTKLKMDEGVSRIRYEDLELSDTQDCETVY